jgi:hypothetical protein
MIAPGALTNLAIITHSLFQWPFLYKSSICFSRNAISSIIDSKVIGALITNAPFVKNSTATPALF